MGRTRVRGLYRLEGLRSGCVCGDGNTSPCIVAPRPYRPVQPSAGVWTLYMLLSRTGDRFGS